MCNDDDDFYLIERFGLTAEEYDFISTYMKGILPYLGSAPSDTCLSDELSAAYWSARDHTTFGRDLDFLRNDSPEMPGTAAYLAQKLTGFAPWKQVEILAYAFGFRDGTSAAQRRMDETAARKTPPPGWTEV